MKRLFQVALISTLMTALTACGFQMRGDWTLPSVMQQTAYTSGSRDLFNELERNFRAASASITRSDSTAGGTRLRVTGETMSRRVLSVDNTGKAIEYELFYVLTFDVLDGNGNLVVKPQRMTMTRDYLFAAADVHGTSRQETLLREEMRKEMANLILRRIQASAR